MLFNIPFNAQFVHSNEPLTLFQVIPYNRQLETINLPVMKIATRPTIRAAWVNLPTPIPARFHANVMVNLVATPPSAKLPTVPPLDVPPLPEGQISGIPPAVPIPAPQATPTTGTTATTAPPLSGGQSGMGQYTPTPSPPDIPAEKAPLLSGGEPGVSQSTPTPPAPDMKGPAEEATP